MWTALSLLAILVLATQYIYFHVDVLAANSNNHNWLNRFCQITGCEIPVQTDTSLIQSSQLVVHSHPTTPNALVVDAVIINQANFDQPFPLLALSFEDIQGRSIAKRHFQPEEYLAGDLANIKLMPSQQSIRLMLEVIDPGPEAVNYSLYIPE
jgi:hypothetical protein